MASGDGVVVKASWCGGGGNCVKIRHNSSYNCIAHIKIAAIIKKGKTKQGQTIDCIGSSGGSGHIYIMK